MPVSGHRSPPAFRASSRMPQRGGTTLATPGKRGGAPTARHRAHRGGDGGGRLPAASAPPPARVDQAACTLRQGGTARRRRPRSSAFFAASARPELHSRSFASHHRMPPLSCVGRATHAIVANSWPHRSSRRATGHGAARRPAASSRGPTAHRAWVPLAGAPSLLFAPRPPRWDTGSPLASQACGGSNWTALMCGRRARRRRWRRPDRRPRPSRPPPPRTKGMERRPHRTLSNSCNLTSSGERAAPGPCPRGSASATCQRAESAQVG